MSQEDINALVEIDWPVRGWQGAALGLARENTAACRYRRHGRDQTPFRSVHAAGNDWRRALRACLDQIEPDAGGVNLGVVYVADPLSEMAGEIVRALTARTGFADWVGACGFGVAGGPRDCIGEGGIGVLLGTVPASGVRLLHAGERPANDDADATILLHGEAEAVATRLGDDDAASPYRRAFGSVTSSPHPLHIAGEIGEGGLSGIVFGERVAMASGLALGGVPIGPLLQVTSCHGRSVFALDQTRALDSLRATAGELLARDRTRLLDHVQLAEDGDVSDGSAHCANPIVGMDEAAGSLALARPPRLGSSVRFVRRDPAVAQAALTALATRLRDAGRGRRVAAALYHAGRGRGHRLFGPSETDTAIIRRALGDVPLVGLIGDGEIYAGRVHAMAGVLTLFFD